MMSQEVEMEMLGANVLEGRALVVEDFDEAMEALRMPKTVDKGRAQQVALKILHEGIGDVFYQAYAFEVLYDISVADAVKYVEENSSTVDPYILGSMLTCIAVDVESIENRDYVAKAVTALRRAIAIRSIEDLSKIREPREFFEDAFPLS
jgi:hypothetical protein